MRSAARITWILAIRMLVGGSGSLLLTAGCDGGLEGAPSRGVARLDADGTNLESEFLAPDLLRRLTASEYQHSVSAILGARAETLQLPQDESVGGFAVNTLASVSASHVDAYRRLATQIAEQTAPMQLSQLDADCAPADAEEALGEACLHDVASRLGRALLRRPLSAAQLQRYVALAVAAGDDAQARVAEVQVAALIAVLLQSPYFLYRVELGTGEKKGAGLTLSQHESAARLAFFLTGNPPDAELTQAADSSSLDDLGTREQAQRLLDQAASADALSAFVLEWLELNELTTLVKSAVVYPQFGKALRDSMLEETRRFAQARITRPETSLSHLLLDSDWEIDEQLAALYGVSLTGIEREPGEFVQVGLPENERFGVLTQAAFLAAHARVDQSSPVKRGKFVRDRLLCQSPPAPPPNVQFDAPDPSSGLSTRERFAVHTESPTCAACHRLMDPIGFGFERYDGVGKYRDYDAGDPVDDRGEIVDALGDPSFEGARELVQLLLGSRELAECFTRQVATFALGVDPGPTELGPVTDAFVDSGLELRTLSLALIQSDAFRSVPFQREAPTDGMSFPLEPAP